METMRAVKTSIKLIERAISEKWIKQLAFYHMFKFRYNNSCIYEYKSRMDELATQLKISTKTLYNYLKVLGIQDLIHDHSGNLILKSIREFRIRRKRALIFLDNDKTLFDITCLLYAKILEEKAKRQAFLESVRRFGRGDKYKSDLRENPFRPSLSYRTIAKLLHISENKAFKVVKNLNKLEVLKTEKQYPRLISEDGAGLQCYVEDKLGYRFTIGGRLYEQFGCYHEFLQFPVFLRNITLRQYKRLINNYL